MSNKRMSQLQVSQMRPWPLHCTPGQAEYSLFF